MIYVKCLKCNEEIKVGQESKDDPIWCTCKNVGVIGGAGHYKILGQSIRNHTYQIKNKKGEE